MPKAARATIGEGFSVEVDAKEFAACLTQVSRACSTRGEIEVLRGVRILAAGEWLQMAACNLEITMRASVPATVATEGAAVLGNPKAAVALLKSLTGPVTVACEPPTNERGSWEVVVVAWSGARYTFPTVPLQDFPALPVLDGSTGEVSTAALVSALQHVLPVVSGDESRPVLCGVLLELDGSADVLRAVATDSYRLAFAERPGACPSGALAPMVVPGSALAEVLRLAKRRGVGETVAWSTNVAENADGPTHVGFTVGGCEVMTRRVDGKFPDYTQLMPDKFEVQADIVGAELSAAAKRVASVLTGHRNNTPVRVSLDAAGVVTVAVFGNDGEGASETLPTPADVTYGEPPREKGESHEPMPEIGFNAAFLAEAARSCGETVRLRLISPLRPAVFLPVPGLDWHLLMPIRLAS